PQPGGECTLATGTWVPAGPAGATPPATPPSRPHWNGKGASPPNVKLFIHLPSSTFFTPGPASTGTAVPTHGGAPASSDASGSFGVVEGKGIVGELVCDPRTVREWFTRPTLA